MRTATHPVTAVVFNNGQWGAEKRGIRWIFTVERYTATDLDNPNFSRVAAAMGAKGIRVEALDQISDALRAGDRSGKPPSSISLDAGTGRALSPGRTQEASAQARRNTSSVTR